MYVRAIPHQHAAGRSRVTYIELVAFYIFEVDGHRMSPGLCLVDIAYPMGCQIDCAILVVGQLVFPMNAVCLV